MKTRRRLALLGVVSVAMLLVTPWVGVEPLPVKALLAPSSAGTAATILWQIRVPRVLVAFLAGAALAVGGAVFQAVFRNPLATPFTLGVASGAACGVALTTRLGVVVALSGLPLDAVAALGGALLAVLVVWGLARLRPSFSSTALLLAGVAMSFFFSSLILFLQYTAAPGDSFRIVRWLMGGLGAVDWPALARMAPFAVAGVAVLGWRARELDLLAVGSDIAASRGVEVKAVQRTLFFATSIMVGGVVAVCGPIGFVGLMAPHICRMLVGAEHRRLLPASCLFGGAFLALCDSLARTVIAPAELPVGVITAFLGGPFFLWLLRRTRSLHEGM